jgi:hypothetical protein
MHKKTSGTGVKLMALWITNTWHHRTVGPNKLSPGDHQTSDTRPETLYTKFEGTKTTMKMVDDDACNNASLKDLEDTLDDSSENENCSSSSCATGTTGIGLTAGIPEAILARAETLAVHYSRIMVAGVLLISLAVSMGVTFWLVSQSEQHDFQVQVSTFCFMCYIS